jgi:hypothetical protein
MGDPRSGGARRLRLAPRREPVLKRHVPTPPAEPPASPWLRLVAIDLRSLALFRIALGVLILAGLASRVVDFRVFFTDEGVWPVSVAWAEDWVPGMWSLHLVSGSWAWQAGLSIAEALAGLALLLGWRTRTVAVLAWVLVASAQKRDVMIVSGAGALLRQFLFWGMWLPLGARWSLDARRRGRGATAPDSVCSVASAALLLQVVLVYWANVIYKSDPAWRSTGDAIWMALSQETYARPLGRWLLAWPGLLRALTHATFALEALGPLLVLIPWRTDRWRLLAVSLFIPFHATLAATMYLGFFPFVSIAGWLLFLGSQASRLTGGPASVPAGRLPSSRWHRPASFAAAACFALTVCWNLRPAVPALKILDPLAHALRLEQRWAMFAPKPREVDSWCVVVGTDATGAETNLWNGDHPVNWKRPRDFAAFFPSDTWKLYFLNLRSGSGPRARLFAEWLAQKWRREHPGAAPFKKLEVYHLEESIYARGAMPDNYLIYDSSAAAR